MSNFLTVIKNNKALSWILGFQIFRFFLLPFMGLMPQDAYYFLYGQYLSLSYFDHPGMIGYLLRFTSEVFGTSVFVVKFTDFLITSITLYVFYQLCLCFLSKQRSFVALLLLTSTLFVSVLSFNSTPDVPLILFWSLSVLFLHKAIFQNKKVHWIFAGIAMGLAFNSKYTAILLQFGLISFLIFSNRYRKLLLSPWLWMCLIISIAITFPVWYWNYQNEWASFAFQSSNRTGKISEFNITPKYFLGAVAHQTALLLPILFCSFVMFTFKYVKRVFTKFKLPSLEVLFLLAFFIPTFLGFFLLTPVYWVKLNWMMPSYITGVIIASLFLSKKWVKYQLITSVVFHLLVAVQVLFYLVPIKSDDTWVGWEELSDEVNQLQKQYPNSFVFSEDGYKTSAVLNFYQNQKVYAQNIIGKAALHFDYLGDDLTELIGKNALFIDSDKRFKNKDKRNEYPKELDNHFTSVEELEPIIINYQGKEVRKFWVYYCSNFQTKK